MMMAVEEQRRQKRRARAIDALLVLRCKAPAVNDARIHAARQQGRP
ncbi:MAG TPA: hypothetical protein VK138_02370 [Acidiferrobacterales bacterium]|nr:hypothetical protein [Acidiferrobacterales bacterium]